MEVVELADVLIRDLSDAVLAGVDAHAARLGLSRVEYIRRPTRLAKVSKEEPGGVLAGVRRDAGVTTRVRLERLLRRAEGVEQV